MRTSWHFHFSVKLLAVSKSAAEIRLRQLGYLEERPYAEFVDPLEVWA